MRINIHTRSRVISIAHPVLTIPYVWRVTHEYINEGLKQGLNVFKTPLLSILGLQAIKGHNIVNIYKMMFYPLKHKFSCKNKSTSLTFIQYSKLKIAGEKECVTQNFTLYVDKIL